MSTALVFALALLIIADVLLLAAAIGTLVWLHWPR